MAPASLTLIILTFNEEMHLDRCIASAKEIAERIVVVDSYSTDSTVDIAHKAGAEVLQRKFKNQADQFQWALDTLEITSDWILRLDADEYLEPKLREEIATRLAGLERDITGVRMKRKVYFRGRWIKWGGYYPSVFLRLWRTGAARVEQRFMDEHTVLTHGKTIQFDYDFVDENLRDITWWTEKHNGFTTRHMVDFLSLEYPLFKVDHGMEQDEREQASFRRFLRNKVFGRTPLYLRGMLYFIYRYFFRLGILDGRQGFVFHFLQGCWKWMLVDAKIEEAKTFIEAHGVEAFKDHLRERHNIEVPNN